MNEELERIKTDFAALPIGDEGNRKRLLMELETVARHALDKDADRFIEEMQRIDFHPRAFIAGAPDRTPQTWAEGQQRIIALIDSIEHAIGYAGRIGAGARSPRVPERSLNRVFLVHGHDVTMLRSVEAYLGRLKLDAVVLGEEANRGRTLIEKFEQHSDVTYAVVILSPDDIGRATDKPPADERPRPRQNAVLELGYFMGRLGRERVAAIVDAKQRNVEYPSDINGIAFIPFNEEHDEWQLLLVREFRAAGLQMDESRV